MKQSYLFTALLLAAYLQASAQWTSTTPPFGAFVASYGVKSMSVPTAQTVWVSARNVNGSGANNIWARTTDGGQTWITGNTGSSTSTYSITSISALSADTAFMTIAGSGGQLVRTTNGGASWTNVLPAAFAAPSGYPNFVHFFDRLHGIVAGDPIGTNPDWEIYTTADAGQTWTALPITNIPAPVAAETGTSSRYAAQGNHIWFLTKKGRVFHSNDRGLHFTASTVGTPTLHHTTFLDSLTGYANMLGVVNKTTDGGQTWLAPFVAGPMHYYWYERIPGTNAMISTGLNANNNDVGSSYSPDNGQNWISIETQIPGTMVRFFDNATGYLASTASGPQSFYKWSGSPFQQTTAVAEKQAAGKLNVWPNPGTGQFNVSWPENARLTHAVVLDGLGRIVMTRQLQPGYSQTDLQLLNQPAGIYHIELFNETGTAWRQKLVKF